MRQRGQPRKTLAEVQAIVAKTKFMERTFTVVERERGYLFQLHYMEADVEDPAAGLKLQRARKWYVSPYSTTTEIVESIFKACRISMDHVLKEHFLYEGLQVYSPHFDVEARAEMCRRKRFSSRVPKDEFCSKCNGERVVDMEITNEDTTRVPCECTR